MDIAVNLFAVTLAAVSSMVVGMVWYSPRLFYRRWSQLAHVKAGKNLSGADFAILYGTVFIASLVTAFVLAFLSFLANQFFQNSFFQDALMTALWVWVGFVVSRFYVHDGFEGRKLQLTAINTGHELVTLLVMALIIGALGY